MPFPRASHEEITSKSHILYLSLPYSHTKRVIYDVFSPFLLCCLCRNGKCKKIEEGQECLQGMRLRQYHMLCGALLRVWKRVSDVVSDITNSSILQIVRLKTKQHNKQVG